MWKHETLTNAAAKTDTEAKAEAKTSSAVAVSAVAGFWGGYVTWSSDFIRKI